MYWRQKFKSFGIFFFRFIILIGMIAPAILQVVIKIKIPWVDLVYSFLMGLLFAFNFLYLSSWLLQLSKVLLHADFFSEIYIPNELDKDKELEMVDYYELEN